MMGRTNYPSLHFRISDELNEALEEAAKKSNIAAWSKNDQARFMLEEWFGVRPEPWMPTQLKHGQPSSRRSGHGTKAMAG